MFAGAAFAEYAAQANSKVVIGVQLENKAAFEASVLDAILQVQPSDGFNGSRVLAASACRRAHSKRPRL